MRGILETGVFIEDFRKIEETPWLMERPSSDGRDGT